MIASFYWDFRISEMLLFYEQLHSVSEIETTSALNVTLKFKI